MDEGRALDWSGAFPYPGRRRALSSGVSCPETPGATTRPSPPDDLAAGILEGLNPTRTEAVTHDQGPLLIVAGAGTGPKDESGGVAAPRSSGEP